MPQGRTFRVQAEDEDAEVITLVELVDQNRENTELINDVLRINVGDVLDVGGGAFVELTITRLT